MLHPELIPDFSHEINQLTENFERLRKIRQQMEPIATPADKAAMSKILTAHGQIRHAIANYKEAARLLRVNEKAEMKVLSNKQ